ncbi:MAG: diguanylate cyclase [Proteobacteria bacterium]|nr:diguanylate cyclase [Pseudomonadota bacterium]
MGRPLRRWWRAFALLAVMSLPLGSAGMLASVSAGVPASGYASKSAHVEPVFTIARLDADPVPARVLAGEFNEQFVTGTPADRIDGAGRTARWWRLTALQPVPAEAMPHLVLHSPHLARVEVWAPGEVIPQRSALMGPDANDRFSTRALLIPLDGLAAGEHIHLRLATSTPRPIRISIDPLAQVHREDLKYAALRAAVLTTLLVLAILAFGFWVAIGEHSYGFLMLTLLSQLCYMVSIGGELRVLPVIAELLGTDPRISRLFALGALITSVAFLGRYLELGDRQPRLHRLLKHCNIAAAVLVVLTLISVSGVVPLLFNLLALLVGALLFGGGVHGAMRGQRAAWFVVVAWLPLLALVSLRLGERMGLWLNPAWVDYAFPSGLAIAALALTVGLADKMQQLRRDRDQASRMASYDTLTGATSRSVIEQHLKGAVADAHRLDRPLSVVFFDIDRFKQINDVYGHRVGDQCLRIIAMRTRNRLRTYDQMGRFGGDEMIVVLPDTDLAEAVARYAFKLMAYKDEYEVARLYTSGEFRRQVEQQFEGDYKLRFHLAPPLLAKKDAQGRLVKREFGPWLFTAFKLVAKLKFLRGGPLDVFGYTEERRSERQLIEAYFGTIEGLLGTLDRGNVDLAVQIASIPEHIRGFGYVKHAHLERARAREAELLAQWRNPLRLVQVA